jgi:hypothetical protein
MDYYYVNSEAQSNGDHEVHRTGCPHPPVEYNREPLGYFSNCHDAVREAQKRFNQVNGCYWCNPECHTG